MANQFARSGNFFFIWRLFHAIINDGMRPNRQERRDA